MPNRVAEDDMQEAAGQENVAANTEAALDRSLGASATPRTRRKMSVWNQERELDSGEVERGVRFKFVLDRLREVQNTREMMSDLFIFVPFLIMFVFFFLAGRGVSDAYFTVQGMRDLMLENEFPGIEVKKTFFDISTAGDWNSWVDGVVLLYLWDPKTPAKTYSYLGAEDVHYAIGQNILLGKLRLRTLRAGPKSCIPNQNLYPNPNDALFQGFPHEICYAPFSAQALDKRPFGALDPPFAFTDAELSSGSATTGDVDRYPVGGYEVYINFTDSLRTAQAVVKTVVDGKFVDNIATRFIIVEFFVYTPQFNTFTSVKCFNEVTAGGAWIPNTQFRLFRVWSRTDIAKTIFDFVFFAFVLYYVGEFFSDWYHYHKQQHKLLGFITQMWNFLEIVNLLVFMVVFGLRIVWILRSVALDTKIPFIGMYPGELEELLWLYSMQVYLNSVNTIITFLKLLKFVRLNDRLNILTRTMEASQQNIIGVLILFVFVVFGYAITGTTLFGTSMWDWRNLNTSFSTLLRMLLGDFDYPAMREENRFLAGIFFYSFVILGLFLLLNFIIAIIAESFSNLNAQTKEVSVDEQLTKLIRDVRYNLKPVNLKHQLASVCKRRGRSTLYKEMIANLEIRYNAQKENQQVFREADEDDITLFRSDLPQYVPIQILSDLGHGTVDHLWNEIQEEFDRQKDTIKDRERAEQIANIQEGVDEAMGKSNDAIQGLDDRVADIERSLMNIEGILRSAGRTPEN